VSGKDLGEDAEADDSDSLAPPVGCDDEGSHEDGGGAVEHACLRGERGDEFALRVPGRDTPSGRAIV
jgi:hypothetical protein